MKQQVAIYLRLSQEDIDKRTSRVKDESNSISAQRLLITRDSRTCPGLAEIIWRSATIWNISSHSSVSGSRRSTITMTA